MGSIVGSLVGAAVLVVLPQALTFLHEYEQALLGLILMVFMIFLRGGIVPVRCRDVCRDGANDEFWKLTGCPLHSAACVRLMR